ncbi:carotenoid oxygenase family protein [Francisellaceae bacterium]|nr:carotenoid oxygenase family protein [Francisellaceae bacterium]
MIPNYRSGFETLTDEYTPMKLAAEVNNLPNWYSGDILRIGPAKFEIGKIKLNHWFDGLGMIYKFEFKNNAIYLSNSFIKSDEYHYNVTDKMKQNTFATVAPKNIFKKLFHIVRSLLGLSVEKSNCNVNFMKVDNHLLAITEVVSAMEFNPKDLSTTGDFTYKDKLKGQVTCAHPQFDPETGEQFNFVVDFGKSITYTIFKLQKNSLQREKTAEFKSKDFFYSHSIFLTKNYIIICAGPIRAKGFDFLIKSFNESLYYDHQAECEFICINRLNGEITRIKHQPFIFLHSVNAFERDGKIYLDSIVYDEKINPYDIFYLQNINAGKINISTKLKRHVVDIQNHTYLEDVITDQTTEFPRINMQYALKEYEYLYAAIINKKTPNDFLNGLAKINVKTGIDQQLLFKTGEYVSEPIFIRNPKGITEDDGIIFMNILDTNQDKTYIIFLDAKNLTVIYKAYLPIKMPFALHGIHIK